MNNKKILNSLIYKNYILYKKIYKFSNKYINLEVFYRSLDNIYINKKELNNLNIIKEYNYKDIKELSYKEFNRNLLLYWMKYKNGLDSILFKEKKKKVNLYDLSMKYKEWINSKEIDEKASNEDKNKLDKIKNNELKEYNKLIGINRNKWENYISTKKSIFFVEKYKRIIKKKKELTRVREAREERENKWKFINKVIDENKKIWKSNKLSVKLTNPYYFFPTGYIEKSMPSELRHRLTAEYNFNKKDKAKGHLLDMYTKLLLEQFFAVESITRKKINFKEKTINIFNISLSLDILNSINSLIGLTSDRLSLYRKKITTLPSKYLELEWVKREINSYTEVKELLKERKEAMIIKEDNKYKVRKINFYTKKLGIIIGKPMFRHTNFNVIIDLFVFNNKKYKLGQLSNMLLRRSMYKYMYSMYVNYSKKILETINRPRFFYINIINPKIVFYYEKIVKLYGDILIKFNKAILIYIVMELLKWRKEYRNYKENMKNKIFNYGKKESFFFNYRNIYFNFSRGLSLSDIISRIKYKNYKNRINTNISFKRYKIDKKKEEKNYYNNRNIVIRIEEDKKDIYSINKELIKPKIKTKKENRNWNKYVGLRMKKKNSTYKNYEKYFKEIEKKSNLPIDMTKLTIWSTVGLNKRRNENENKIRIKKFGPKKYSYAQYKRKFFFDNKKKKPINPKIWEQKLMNFNLYSQIQKKDSRPQKKYLLYNKNIEFKSRLLNNNENNISINNINIFNNIYNDNNKLKINNKYNKNKSIYGKNNKLVETKFEDRKENLEKLYTNKIENNDINNYLNFKNNAEINMISENVNKESNIYIDTHDKLVKEKERKMEKKIKEKGININKSSIFMEKENNNENIRKKKKLNKLFTLFFIENKNLNFVQIRRIKKRKDIIKNYINSKNIIINSNLNVTKNKDKNVIIKSNIILNKKEKELNNWDLIVRKIKLSNYYKDFYNKHIKKEIDNSKENWDELDKSLLSILSKIFWIDEKIKPKKRRQKIRKNQLAQLSWNVLYNKSRNLLLYSNYWYLSYYINFIKNEFNLIYKDLIVKDSKNILPYNDINFSHSQNKVEEMYSKFDYNKGDIRREILKKILYLNGMIKPYYRNLILFYIMELYKSMLVYIGYERIEARLSNIFRNKFKGILHYYNYHSALLDFILVKTILNILRYNYRSIIRGIQPKYFNINKIRYYYNKYTRLSMNTWLTSIKNIKRLRKPSMDLWERYDKLTNFYYQRIKEQGQNNSKRKVLMPFVFYIEDLLYIIYGKWVLIRLWPLKKRILSSYMLIQYLSQCFEIAGKFVKIIKNFKKILKNLVFVIKITRLMKAHDYYTKAKLDWPNELLKKVNRIKSGKNLTYQNMQYYDQRIGRDNVLNRYPLRENKLIEFYPLSQKTEDIYMNRKEFMISKKRRSKFNSWLTFIKNRNLNKIEENWLEVYLWSKPIKNYITSLRQSLDILGYRIVLAGRIPLLVKKSMRRYYSIINFEKLIAPRHWHSHSKTFVSLYRPHINGNLPSHLNYAYQKIITQSGILTIKLWLNNTFSSDLQELLLHLSQIKSLYFELLNRSYVVSQKYGKLTNNLNLDFYLKLYKTKKKRGEKKNKF